MKVSKKYGMIKFTSAWRHCKKRTVRAWRPPKNSMTTWVRSHSELAFPGAACCRYIWESVHDLTLSWPLGRLSMITTRLGSLVMVFMPLLVSSSHWYDIYIYNHVWMYDHSVIVALIATHSLIQTGPRVPTCVARCLRHQLTFLIVIDYWQPCHSMSCLCAGQRGQVCPHLWDLQSIDRVGRWGDLRLMNSVWAPCLGKTT